MNIIPEPYKTILQFILFAIFIYWLVRYRTKNEESDRDVAIKTLQMVVFVFFMVFSCVTPIVFYDYRDGLKNAFEVMEWVAMALLLIGGLYIEFKYGHKKEIHTQRPDHPNDHL